MIVFDIETGPLSDDHLQAVLPPWQAPPHPGEFDPSTVRYGNTRDQAKKAAKLKAAQEKHTGLVTGWEAAKEKGEAEYWSMAREKAALSPVTGRVLAIGYFSTDTGGMFLDISDDEPGLLRGFWGQYQKCRRESRKLVGHNSKRFDVRFIICRSWVHGIDVPEGVIQRGRFLDDTVFFDTMELWGEPIRLGTLAVLLGVGAKPEGMDGSMFAELLKTDRKQAEAYLRNDLEITKRVAERMGLI